MTFSYYLDGLLIGFVPIDAERMSASRFSLAVGVHGARVKGYIDDVRVGLINESTMISSKPIILFDETHNAREVLSYEKAKEIHPEHPESYFLGEFIKGVEFDYQIERHCAGRLTEQVLNEVDILILASPRREFSDQEVEAIKGFIDRGGGMLFWSEFNLSEKVANRILNEFGMSLNRESIACDSDCLWDHTAFWARDLTNHWITTDIDGMFMAGACSFDIVNPAQSLIKTSADTWRDSNQNNKYDPNEVLGPFVVAAISGYKKGRVLAFCDDTIALFFDQNGDLLMNALAWLSEPSMQRK